MVGIVIFHIIFGSGKIFHIHTQQQKVKAFWVIGIQSAYSFICPSSFTHLKWTWTKSKADPIRLQRHVLISRRHTIFNWWQFTNKFNRQITQTRNYIFCCSSPNRNQQIAIKPVSQPLKPLTRNNLLTLYRSDFYRKFFLHAVETNSMFWDKTDSWKETLQWPWLRQERERIIDFTRKKNKNESDIGN